MPQYPQILSNIRLNKKEQSFHNIIDDKIKQIELSLRELGCEIPDKPKPKPEKEKKIDTGFIIDTYLWQQHRLQPIIQKGNTYKQKQNDVYDFNLTNKNNYYYKMEAEIIKMLNLCKNELQLKVIFDILKTKTKQSIALNILKHKTKYTKLSLSPSLSEINYKTWDFKLTAQEQQIQEVQDIRRYGLLNTNQEDRKITEETRQDNYDNINLGFDADLIAKCDKQIKTIGDKIDAIGDKIKRTELKKQQQNKENKNQRIDSEYTKIIKNINEERKKRKKKKTNKNCTQHKNKYEIYNTETTRNNTEENLEL